MPALPREYATAIAHTPPLTSAEESLLLARVTTGTAAARTLAAVAVTPALRARLEADVADARAAKERLVLANLHLVPAVAKSWVGHLPYADLVQEGSLGLVRAVESYSPERGSFSGYARRWVRRSVARAVAASGTAASTWAPEAPLGTPVALGRIRQALSHLDALEARVLELRFGLVDGMSRSLDEISRRLGVTRERVSQILEGALAHMRQVFEPAGSVMA
ncbi:sigma-70 family RNA polymerase sigma factor [Antribacter gilvus]|uniref:sigma-70 family RNA polymerase sigma factor n=1 Tax=Antribacter gilvus TaxID=2304675 RepID=UPI0013E07E3F|nr:sigma-70 family RNA polymerase sigma factor [Antribacter gilvus]